MRSGWGYCVFLLLVGALAKGADLEKAEQLFGSGNYAQCLSLAKEGLADRPYSEDWQALVMETLLAVGRYPEAQTVVSNALERSYASPRVQWLAREVFLENGRTEEAEQMVDRMLRSASSMRGGGAASLVALGRAALLRKADPKLVLDRIFDAAKKLEPDSREPYLAIGELALEKHDFALAAKTFQEGLEHAPADPDLLQGLAEAYRPNQQALMVETLETALKHNTNHVASLLSLAEHAIDAEAYHEAAKQLDRVIRVNPWQAEAWAYRAVIAAVQNQPEAAKSAREKALKFWSTNPRVPYLIGRKLSQKYRFAEGSRLQREALGFDPDYLPAKVQLAQDLLRLGEEREGWRLVEEVQKADAYNVTANNLVSLHDAMRKFEVVTNAHFALRMAPHEAKLYGARALELLEAGRKRLCEEYGCTLPKRTLVEVFTNQADFAVRTFALPQNDGYLGVCFGNVITANSPGAYPGHPFNWESMLWHEFCHVITLNLTQNRMPRWLSEGISVYEERQANPAWGEHLTPRYREMILEGELTPIRKLSAAFLMPRSGEHLQFTYYESSLVVQFLVERFGFSALQAILRDLAGGAEINQSIAQRTVEMDVLEKDFADYAKQTAERMGPGLDWEQPQLGGLAADRRPPTTDRFDWAGWVERHPTNFYAMTGRAQEWIEAAKWSEAKPILKRLIELCPEAAGPQSAYSLLAEAHRGLGETKEEREVLEQLAERDDEVTEAYARLMELARDAQDWRAVALNARRYRAVNPLVRLPYRFLVEACEKTGDLPAATEAWRALLALDPPDPAQAHYRLAKLLHEQGDPGARREVLQALEEAPRYRDALRLLLEIHKSESAAASATSYE